MNSTEGDPIPPGDDPADDWERLERYLVLGSEGGSYHASRRPLSREGAGSAERCIRLDGRRAVERIVAVSEAARAPRNEPAIFALALAAQIGDFETRREALTAVPRVCRVGPELTRFAEYLHALGGAGRTPAPGGQLSAHGLSAARERAKWATGVPAVVQLITEPQLPRDCIATQTLGDARVWAALLDHMPLGALLRNLATMTRVGLLAPSTAATAKVIERLADGGELAAARVHPMSVLAAQRAYAAGRRGPDVWSPVAAIVDALDAAFYASFAHVAPAGGRLLLALDVSPSMGAGRVAGIADLTPRLVSAAMALLAAATEAGPTFVAFTAPPADGPESGAELCELHIAPRSRLDAAVDMVAGVPPGPTDCALPMRWALERRLPVDTFIVYTDAETGAGAVAPGQALRRYRREMGIAAKLIVVGLLSSGFSIADRGDAGMLDVVGFDSATPAIVTDFARAQTALSPSRR